MDATSILLPGSAQAHIITYCYCSTATAARQTLSSARVQGPTALSRCLPPPIAARNTTIRLAECEEYVTSALAAWCKQPDQGGVSIADWGC